ncbi:MAG: conjugal transfer protein TraG N-terminal domain-containing protein [bacterium]
MLTIWAFGSGYIEFGIMQAIAQMFSGNQVNILFASMMVAGSIMIGATTMIGGYSRPGSHLTLGKYLIGVMALYALFIVPKVTVHIQDTVVNSQSNAYVVTGVPFGIGGVMAAMSNMQMYMTQLLETNFSTPTTVDLTNAGMGFSLTSQNLADNVTISDPYLFRDFDQFVYNCVMPGLSTAGGIGMFALEQAGSATNTTASTYSTASSLSFMQVISAYTSGQGQNIPTEWFSGNSDPTEQASGQTDPTGITTTCGQETTWLQTAMNYYISQDAGPALAGSMGYQWQQFSGLYTSVNNSLYNMANGATNQFMQMAYVNSYNGALMDAAKLAGLNANSLAYGAAEANLNMSNSFMLSGFLASEYLPVAYGIISSLIMAFSVILLLLMFLPTGVNYLKMFFELQLFIAVWPPLMAIHNFIFDLIIQHGYTALSGQGFSLLSAHSYGMQTSAYLNWAGYTAWSIPMFAYALVTGSTYAMVNALSSVDSAAKSSASRGGAMATTGDVNLGKANAVVDVASGQKLAYYNTRMKDVGKTDINGAGTFKANGNQSQYTSASGNVISIGQDGKVSRITDPNLSGNITNAATAGRQQAYSTAKSNETSYGQTWNSSMGKTAEYMNQFGSSLNGSEQKQFSADSKKSFMQVVNGDKSLSATQKTDLVAEFEANAGVKGGGFGAGFKAIQKSDLSAEQKASLTSKYSHDLGQSVTNSGSIGWSAKSVDGSTLANKLNAAETTSKTYSDMAKQVKSLSDSISKSQNVSGTVAQNALLGYMDKYNQDNGYTLGNGYTKEQISKLDDKELDSLNKNAAPFENYVANNPNILKAENAVPNGSGIKGVPSKPAALAALNKNYNINSGGINANNPYAHFKSPQKVKAEVAKLQKPAAKYDPAHTTTKETPFNSLTPEQKLHYARLQAKKGANGAANFVPDVLKFATLGTYEDLTGQLGKAGRLGKNIINDLPKLHLNANPTVPVSTFHPGKLKIMSPTDYNLQRKTFERLTGGIGYKNIVTPTDANTPAAKTVSALNKKLNTEAPLPEPPDATK